MFNSKKLIYLVAGLLILIIAYLGYRSYSNAGKDLSVGVSVLGPDGQPLTNSTEAVDADATRFLALLQSVKNIDKTINEQFIKDPYYTILKDYTVPIPVRPLSRANPFLNIGLGGAYTPSTGGAGTGGININISTTTTNSSAGTPADNNEGSSGLSPSAQEDLLRALQQQ